MLYWKNGCQATICCLICGAGQTHCWTSAVYDRILFVVSLSIQPWLSEEMGLSWRITTQPTSHRLWCRGKNLAYFLFWSGLCQKYILKEYLPPWIDYRVSFDIRGPWLEYFSFQTLKINVCCPLMLNTPTLNQFIEINLNKQVWL